MIVLTVMLLKGWPNVAESSNHIAMFPIIHPLMHTSWFMSIYLTVLLTLERFHAIYLNRLSEKQGNNTRIKLSIVLIFVLVIIYNIPKFMEYTWISSSIRTEYDSDDKLWSNLTKNYKYKQIVEDNGHFDFLMKYRDITELGTGASAGEGGKFSIHFSVGMTFITN